MPDNDVALAPAKRLADPFRADRAGSGAVVQRFGEEDLLLLLRWKDVRAAAGDPVRFDSGHRGRVPTPPEDRIRAFRQLPIESNPPEHGAWKDIVLPFFRRPAKPDTKPLFEAVVRDHLTRAMNGAPIEIVRDLALPLQSDALVVLLDTDPALAEEWKGWGLHALRTNGQTDPDKAARFLTFIDRVLDRGATDPALGLFSALHTAQFDGRTLARDEMRGICHLALAGGRDTIINAVTGTLAYLAETPRQLERLRQSPELIPTAVEELFRVLSPLAMIGRVCPEGLDLGAHRVSPNARAGLCWAAANRDPDVFASPLEVRLDRNPNPHVAFGAGTHTCLGAPLARLILRCVLGILSRDAASLDVIAASPRRSVFGTPFLFDSLTLRLTPRGDAA